MAPPNDGTQGVSQQPVPSDPTKWTSLEWTFERAETGKNLWAIRPGRNSKQNLDAWGSKPTAGTDVGIYIWNNNNQQKGGINPITYNP